MTAARISYLRAAGGLLIAVVGVWGAWTGTTWSSDDGLYVTGVFALVALFGLLAAGRDFRAGRASAEATTDQDGDPPTRGRVIRLGIVVALTVVYALVWDMLGYAVPTAVYTLAVLVVLGVRNWIALVVTPLAVTAFVLLVLGELLNIPYP